MFTPNECRPPDPVGFERRAACHQRSSGSLAKPSSGRYLPLVECEEIALFKMQGRSIREIGRCLGRYASTISRELRRNAANRAMMENEMIALRKTSAGFGIALTEAPPAPAPRPGEVTLAVEAVGICGSDVHAYEWTDGYAFMVPYLPVTMGHEIAAKIVRVGPDASLAEGTRVTLLGGITCGRCAACRADNPAGCTDRRMLGWTRDGGFAKHLTVPARVCLPLPQNIPPAIGALAEPLGVSCEAVLTGGVGLGDTVLVLGPGTIGQGMALIARAAGAARVLVAGHGDVPRFQVLKGMGFTDLIDVADAPLSDQVFKATSGAKVDVVLEATGHPASITESLKVLRRRGGVVVGGIHSMPLNLSLTDFVRQGHQLRASYGATRSTWNKVLSLLASNPESFRPMISHELTLDRGLQGFELARQRAASKVILMP
ncbi:alcohol dehydrogenase catalytic domain-containing protein [Bradyrhizobium sp. 190]|nr:alcohol dehydrogenase catalytic domain-containing protein [Bradyrhizobium sp. 190]